MHKNVVFIVEDVSVTDYLDVFSACIGRKLVKFDVHGFAERQVVGDLVKVFDKAIARHEGFHYASGIGGYFDDFGEFQFVRNIRKLVESRAAFCKRAHDDGGVRFYADKFVDAQRIHFSAYLVYEIASSCHRLNGYARCRLARQGIAIEPCMFLGVVKGVSADIDVHVARFVRRRDVIVACVFDEESVFRFCGFVNFKIFVEGDEQIHFDVIAVRLRLINVVGHFHEFADRELVDDGVDVFKRCAVRRKRFHCNRRFVVDVDHVVDLESVDFRADVFEFAIFERVDDFGRIAAHDVAHGERVEKIVCVLKFGDRNIRHELQNLFRCSDVHAFVAIGVDGNSAVFKSAKFRVFVDGDIEYEIAFRIFKRSVRRFSDGVAKCDFVARHAR